MSTSVNYIKRPLHAKFDAFNQKCTIFSHNRLTIMGCVIEVKKLSQLAGVRRRVFGCRVSELVFNRHVTSL